jgi:hypothetical protein
MSCVLCVVGFPYFNFERANDYAWLDAIVSCGVMFCVRAPQALAISPFNSASQTLASRKAHFPVIIYLH